MEKIHQLYRRSKNGVPSGDAIPFYKDGVFHLFHLASPPNTNHYPERVRCSWYHLTSTDLINWQEHPIALKPSDNKSDPDNDGVWTGSVIFYDNAYHIFYTGYSKDSENPQTICHAYSTNGIDFIKNENNPIVIPDTRRYEPIDWRDPFVFWNSQENLYWMLISARLNYGPPNLRGCLALATSVDLKKWDIHDPIYTPWNTFCIECPELFNFEDKWFLIYSRFSESAQTIHRVSDSPRGPWKIPTIEGLDGRRWYAAKSAGTSHRRVAFGWVHDREDYNDDGIWQWGGDFCIPRELYVSEEKELRVNHADGLLDLYEEVEIPFFIPKLGKWEIDNSIIKNDTNDQLSYGFFNFHENDFLIDLTIHPKKLDGDFSLIFKSAENLEYTHLLEFSPSLQSVSIVRWPEPLDAFWRDLTDRHVPEAGPDGPRLVEQPLNIIEENDINCRIFIENSIIEVFINQQLALSYRVYTKGDFSFGLLNQSGELIFKNIIFYKRR